MTSERLSSSQTKGVKAILSRVNWVHAILLSVTPALAIYGFLYVPLQRPTLVWTLLYYYFSGLGITAGYHRLWSHKSYDSNFLYKLWMCLAGSAAVEGSIKWWCQGHRAHHRYTDTDDDPYSAHKGLFWSHIGWMLVKKKNDKLKTVDISDLMADPLVRFQHKYYGLFALVMGFLLPTVIAGLGWGDYKGGFFFAAVARLVFVHHATFCVNSLAHYLGDTNYDDKLSPRDHFITALMTFGEGYHNFHHQYPQDYRNAIRFYQFDPTKWVIKALSFYGITYNLKKFPDNEVKKGAIQMKQKKLDVERQQLDWGIPIEQLPIWRELDFKAKLQQKSSLIIIDDIVYDVGNFVDEHPGGKGFLKTSFGKNVTDQFNGKVYDHSNAARNLMTRFRVARLSNTKEE